jgi:hypothetical protein
VKWPPAWTQSVEGVQLRNSFVREAVEKRVICQGAAVKIRIFIWYLECVI